jgi:3-methyladenine DNA glycosylase AlkD
MDREIREELEKYRDSKYADFSGGLIPGERNIIGVRLPQLRKIAKKLARGDWRACLDSPEPDVYFEETLLRGLMIGYIKCDFSGKLDILRGFIPRIDNWSVCDSTVTGLHDFSEPENREKAWDFIVPYFKSEHEFGMRFAAVSMLDYFIDGDHIDRDLELLDTLGEKPYYTMMAAAWALSYCYFSFPEKTLSYLERSSLDKVTYNKALQKITESRQVSPEEKAMIRSMKRK